MKAVYSIPQSIITSLMITVTVFRINCGDVSIFDAFKNNIAYAVVIIFAALTT